MQVLLASEGPFIYFKLSMSKMSWSRICLFQQSPVQFQQEQTEEHRDLKLRPATVITARSTFLLLY